MAPYGGYFIIYETGAFVSVAQRGDDTVAQRGDGIIAQRGDGNIAQRGNGNIAQRGDISCLIYTRLQMQRGQETTVGGRVCAKSCPSQYIYEAQIAYDTP